MAEPILYDVLGVTPDATLDEIKVAYRRHLKYWHPDHNAGGDADARSKAITSAYAVLADPAQRAEYDRRLAAGLANGGTSTSPPPPPPTSGPPPWTRPPGRYRRPRGTGSTDAGAAAGTGRTKVPPPPPSMGADPGWAPTPGVRRTGPWVRVSRTERFWASSRALARWLVQPLREPTAGGSIAAALVPRLAVLAVGAGAVWLTLPLVVTAVEVTAILAVVFVLLGLTVGTRHSHRRRRR